MLAVLAAGLLVGGPASATDQVTLALDCVIGDTHTPYFVAVGKGFYGGQNPGGDDPPWLWIRRHHQAVAAGRATVGVADTSALVADRVNDGVPVKAVFGVYGKAALGILYLRESGFRGPKDLEGRTLARSASGASVILLPAFLTANGVGREKIREVIVDASAFLTMLIARKADAITEQSIPAPGFQKAAEKEGLHVDAMQYSNNGLVSHGNAVMTTDTLAQSNTDLVRRFVQATARGLAYAFEHPD
jgi:NitT/TauT family transport system substrate-binding protein